MPETTRIMTAASGSSRRAKGTEKSCPDVIHVNTRWTTERFAGSSATSLTTAATETANDSTIAPHAMIPAAALLRRRPKLAFSRKPTNGNSGISSSMSPLQASERLGVQRLAMAEQADDDREADGGFGCGHGHHEEHDDLAVGCAERAAERDEAQVHRVQHDLDREQDRDDVAADQHTRRADGEQDCRQDEVVAERRHVRSSAEPMLRPFSRSQPRRPSPRESESTSPRTETRTP